MIIDTIPYEYQGFLIRENDYGKALILNNTKIEESADFVKKENINATFF